MPALPSEVSYGRVTGRVLTAVRDTSFDPDTLPDGVPATGSVVFTPTAMLVSMSSDVVILPQKITVPLDAGGAFEVDLVATDDPDLFPNDWLYNVTFEIAEGQITPFYMAVPSGSTTDLSDMVESDAPEPLPSTLNTLLIRIAALEARPKLYVQSSAPAAPNLNDVWVYYTA